MLRKSPGARNGGRRDAGPARLLFRTVAFREVDKKERTVTVDLSSETPVDRWGDKEILLHGDTNVRLDRLRNVGAFHLYHDYTKPVAAIQSAEIVDKKLRLTIKFGRTVIAEEAWKDVEDGILRGVSVGYDIHAVEYNEDTREIRATDWEPFEGSFTTIPADPTVGGGRTTPEDHAAAWRAVRTRSATTPTQPRPKPRNITVHPSMTAAILLSLCRSFQKHAEKIQRLADKGKTEAQIRAWIAKREESSDADEDREDADEEDDSDSDEEREDEEDDDAGDESERASEIARLRSDNARLRLVETMRNLAHTHNIDTTGFDFSRVTNEAAGLRALLKHQARNSNRRPNGPVGGSVTVGLDGTDKKRDAAVDALLVRHFSGRDLAHLGDAAPKKDLGMRNLRPHEMIRALIPGGERLTRDQMLDFCTRQNIANLNLRDANQSAANFSVVLGNFADKAVQIGYNSHVITHSLWTTERQVDDFKEVYGVALQTGLLKEQDAKGSPGEEMNLEQKSYNAKLGLFLRTLMVTYQDWRNDDLGLFADSLRNVGVLGGSTEDYQVYKLLMGLTWTDYQTTSAAFYDDTNDRVAYTGLGTTQAALQDRRVTINDESIQLNPAPRYLIVPTKREAAALAATGQTVSNHLPQVVSPRNQMSVISSSWLTNPTLTGYSADDYYIVAGNMDAIKVLRDRLNPRPTVRMIDAGATPDMKLLVMHAFKAAVASQEAMQKGDWE